MCKRVPVGARNECMHVRKYSMIKNMGASMKSTKSWVGLKPHSSACGNNMGG